MTDWKDIFDDQWPEPPATEADIIYLQSAVLAPLTQQEIVEVNQAHHHAVPADDPTYATGRAFDAASWRIPNKPFPPSFISFLRWSNGGEFTHGDRQFAPFFSTYEIRETMLAYEVPEYMPGAVPFGFDGGGTFYLFDMRDDPRNGEFPIVFCGAGALDWDAICIADTFPDLCAGTSDPHDDE